SRILSFVDGKVATAKSAHNPAIRNPALAHIAIRHFIALLLTSIILRPSASGRTIDGIEFRHPYGMRVRICGPSRR
ncbi:MAG: hypothetical protein WA372_17630, partial [Candidatus Sulfotelmatobacter sp.]